MGILLKKIMVIAMDQVHVGVHVILMMILMTILILSVPLRETLYLRRG